MKKSYLHETKIKKRGWEGEKIYDWKEFILKKLFFGDVVTMSSVYMTW